MSKFLSAAMVLLIVSLAHAEIIRKECQTEESRGLRYASVAMYRAAKDSDPWQGCSSSCQMQSSIVDSMTATMRRFEAEGRANLLKARAAEAAKCPQWADAIMDLGPVTTEEKDAVATEFQRLMKEKGSELDKLKQWQIDHPQCKHVDWSLSGGISVNGGPPSESTYSPEDFSGKFKGKAGQCSASGKGPVWYGTDDDLKMRDPVTNPLLAKIACSDALKKIGLGEGWYAEPRLCNAQ